MAPIDIEMLIGKRCNPECDVQRLTQRRVMLFYPPAIEADDNMTVWNHTG